MPTPIERYDALYPGVDIPQDQKQERAERLAFKSEARRDSRTNRTRGIVIPALPWKKEA